MRLIIFVVKLALLSAQLPCFRSSLIRSRPTKMLPSGHWMTSSNESGSGCDVSGVGCRSDVIVESLLSAHHQSSDSSRMRSISDTERSSSEQVYDDPTGSDVIVAPVGSGDGVVCGESFVSDDEDCSETTSSSGDDVSPRQRSGANVDETLNSDNAAVVNGRQYDDVTMTSLSSSSARRRDVWSTSAVSRHLPVPTRRPLVAVRTHVPPYRVDNRLTTTTTTTTARRRAAPGPTAAVRRRPGTSLALNIGLIVGIAAGVVVLLLVLGYAVNRYRRCRGGADCGSYRLDRATVVGDSCCRYDGLKLIPSQQHLPPPPPPLSIPSTPRGCYGTSLVKPHGTCKLPSKEWYV